MSRSLTKILPSNNRLERIWKLGQVGFKKRYYNDRLGLLWALLNPGLRITVYYLVFTYVFERGRDGIDNFALFIYAGLLLWLSFTEGSAAGMRILKSNKYLIQNIQFNHFDLFLSSNLSVCMGLMFNTIVYLCLCVILKVDITWINIWFVIPIYFNLFLIITGVSMLLATIKVYLEDITHLWSIVILIGFWSAGIFFPAKLILDKFYPMIYINPFIGMIENMRMITMFGSIPHLNYLFINLIQGLVIFVIGYIYFRRYSYKAMERL